MTKSKLISKLLVKRGYLQAGAYTISKQFGVSMKVAKEARKLALEEIDKSSSNEKEDALYQEFLKWKEEQNPFSSVSTNPLPSPFEGGDPDNVLVIGDLHEPFCLEGYLHFCREVQERDNCGTVVFIGDVIDNHYSSYHESESETMGPNHEFEVAKRKLQRWYKVFPEAYVTIGNHDRIVHRKAKSAGLADQWVVDYSTALETPGWKFVHEVELNGVCYIHGEGGTARTRMKKHMQSSVQGHLHSQFYIEYVVGAKIREFGMQVGCGIDKDAFAFAYGKTGPKPVIGCATVVDKGTNPRLYPMNL